ncbi:DMT family transporter [Proteus mirabilis]|nr:DMT family transporter [Proteus mirabilis]
MKSVIFPLLAVLIWSINAVVNKAATSVIDPAAISFYRWFLAFLLMTPFLLVPVWHHRKTVKQYWWKLFILGALGMGLYQSLAYYAAYYVTATFMGILNSLIPLLTVIISIFVLRVVPTVGIALGTILSISGLVWLVRHGDPSQLLSQGLGRGELMMFIASTAYAFYGVLTKRWSIPLPNWQSLYVQIGFGVLLLIPNFLTAESIALTKDNVGLVIFAGVGASILAPYLWILGVMKLGANTTSIFMNLIPLFTAMIAVAVLGEEMHSYHFIGGGVILLGIFLVQKLRAPLNFRRQSVTKKADCQQEM